MKTSVEDVPKKLTTFLEDYEELNNKISKFKQEELSSLTKSISSSAEDKKGKRIYVGKVSLDSNNDVKDLALQCIASQKVDVIVLISNIGTKTCIVGATAKNIELDISRIVSETSNLYGGGASKDPFLSIGGGPGKYSEDKTIAFIEDALLELI